MLYTIYYIPENSFIELLNKDLYIWWGSYCDWWGGGGACGGVA